MNDPSRPASADRAADAHRTLPDGAAPPRLRFGSFEIDTVRREVLRAGERLRIGSRQFELLLALAHAQPRLLTADELVRIGWAGREVDKNNLRVQITALRKALGADAIRFHPTRGYRLELAVARPEAERAEHADALALPGNLSELQPELFGRTAELASAAAALAEHDRLTLVGAPGVGKTTLALVVAQRQRRAFADGAFLVELAALTTGAQVAPAVAQVLGVDGAAARTTIDLARALGSRQLLLVVDNCEHLPSAVQALCDDLLRAASGVTVLATSRRPLKCAGEQTLRLGPLPLSADETLAAARGSGAVALFEARARHADARFAVTAGNVEAVDRVCRLLEGIPLAIGLAAARVALWGVQGLAQRLVSTLSGLDRVGGAGGGDRHDTLTAAVSWSYDLLSPAEQALLRLLGVFAGSIPLTAVQRLAAARGIGEAAVMKALAGLLDNSLLQADLASLTGGTPGVEPGGEPGGAVRYTMHAIVRDFARAQLAAGDEASAVRRDHAEWCLSLIPDPPLGQPPDAKRTMAPAADVDNLRASIKWSADHDVALAIDLCCRMVRHWRANGEHDEAFAVALPLLAKPVPAGSERLRARLQQRLCAIAYEADRHALVITLATEAIDTLADSGAEGDEAQAWSWLGAAHSMMGELEQGLGHFERAVAIQRRPGDEAGLGEDLANVGWTLQALGRADEARAALAEAMAIARRTANDFGIATAHEQLADLEAGVGRDPAAVLAHARAAVAGYRKLAMQRRLTRCLGVAAGAHRRLGERAAAFACLHEVLTVAIKHGFVRQQCDACVELAALMLDRADRGRAVALLALSDRLRASSNLVSEPATEAECQRIRAAAAGGLDAFALHAANAEGELLTVAQAIRWVSMEAR